jgi:hypothetical protein
MNDIPATFNFMVAERFRYLVDQYNFSIIKTGDGFQNRRDDRRYSLSSELVQEYTFSTPEERAIVCSQDPRDFRTAACLVVSKKLHHDKRQFSNKAAEIDSQLSDHARWLKQYAEPFLKGDFSQWLEIYEYKIARMIGELKRSGRSEYCLRFVGIDQKGKPAYVQEHIFIKSLDYIAGLRTQACHSENK